MNLSFRDKRQTAMTTPLYHRDIPSPVGQLQLIASDTHLYAVLWQQEKPIYREWIKDHGSHQLLGKIELQLQEYFAGTRQQFDLPLQFKGTVFQQQAWQALLMIPYGETWSYAELAQYMGHPTAVRAVGGALNRNPISIICPCHRVIGKNGKLTGFAGGLNIKQYLLDLEK